MNTVLTQVAQTLVAPGKGILAADESTGTITKRFASIKVECTESSRQAYREMLLTAPGLSDSISGVILYDETIRQSTRDGVPFPQQLDRQGIVPGIKVDRGAKPLAGFAGEKVTEGLDGLRERFAEYRALGARFAKWRAVFRIDNHLPTSYGISSNAHALARYAALAQESELVPIVEPEVLMDGSHSLERCYEVTLAVLRAVFDELARASVRLEEMLLKPNMVVPGEDSSQSASVEDVARRTLDCFRQVLPPALPGVVFLSGGQADQLATEHLNAMNQIGDVPWELSFSYGRALQAPALRLWAGKSENASAAQQALLHRARCNSAARKGRYSHQLEQARSRPTAAAVPTSEN